MLLTRRSETGTGARLTSLYPANLVLQQDQYSKTVLCPLPVCHDHIPTGTHMTTYIFHILAHMKECFKVIV